MSNLPETTSSITRVEDEDDHEIIEVECLILWSYIGLIDFSGFQSIANLDNTRPFIMLISEIGSDTSSKSAAWTELTDLLEHS